jgi:hypothetical protein
MVEGMYIVGTVPKSLGEGVIPEAYSGSYETAYNFWEANDQQNWDIYMWRHGGLVKVGRRFRNAKTGKVFFVPIPPNRISA